MRSTANHVVGLRDFARLETVHGPVWNSGGDDLNVNLLVFGAGEGVAEHVNSDLDVLFVVIAGEGTLTIDGRSQTLRVGDAVVISKGSKRSVRANSERLAYLTCHRRRAGLWPNVRKLPG